jgi:hypothetical protein
MYIIPSIQSRTDDRIQAILVIQKKMMVASLGACSHGHVGHLNLRTHAGTPSRQQSPTEQSQFGRGWAPAAARVSADSVHGVARNYVAALEQHRRIVARRLRLHRAMPQTSSRM